MSQNNLGETASFNAATDAAAVLRQELNILATRIFADFSSCTSSANSVNTLEKLRLEACSLKYGSDSIFVVVGIDKLAEIQLVLCCIKIH